MDIAFIKTMVFLAIYAIGVLTSMFVVRKVIVWMSTRDIRKELKKNNCCETVKPKTRI